MAALVLYTERSREYVVIDTADLSDDEFEEEYAARPLARCPIGDAELLTPFPTDRALEV